MVSCQKVSKFDFQSQFSMSKIIFFFIEEYQFRSTFLLLTFFDKINFYIPLLLKWCPIFDSSPLIQNSKFNNFLWVCWCLCKNLSNLIPPLENYTTRTAIMCNDQKWSLPCTICLKGRSHFTKTDIFLSPSHSHSVYSNNND